TAPPADRIAAAERALAQVPWHREEDVLGWVVAAPWHAAIALAVLSDRPRSLVGERIAAIAPELAGLGVPVEAATYEHEADPVPGGEEGRRRPLLEHVLRAVDHAEHALHELRVEGDELPDD